MIRRRTSKKSDALKMGKLSANTRNSEIDLLEEYRKFTKHRQRYLQLYQEHRNNLKAFDAKLGISSSSKSFVDLFDNKVWPKDLFSGTDIDNENPLLINSYHIYNDSGLKDLRIEHIKQQIRYIITKTFNKSQAKSLKDISVQIISPSKVKVEFISKYNKPYFRDYDIDNYLLGFDQIQESIKDVQIKASGNISEFVSEPTKYEAKLKEESAAKAQKDAENAASKAAADAAARAAAAPPFRGAPFSGPPKDFSSAAANAAAKFSPKPSAPPMSQPPVTPITPPLKANNSAPPIPKPLGLPKLDISEPTSAPISETMKRLFGNSK